MVYGQHGAAKRRKGWMGRMIRSRLLLAAAVSGVVLGGVWLYRYTHAAPTVSYQMIALQTDAQRRDWLTACGYSPTEAAPQLAAVLVPACTDSGTFGAYCTMQEAQGLPLADSAGAEAEQITYTVQNSSSESTLLAELLIRSDGTLVGAMLYDPAQPDQLTPLLTC